MSLMNGDYSVGIHENGTRAENATLKCIRLELDAQRLPWKKDTLEAVCLKCQADICSIELLKVHSKTCVPNSKEAANIKNYSLLSMCDASAGLVTKVRMTSLPNGDITTLYKCYAYNCLRCGYQFPTPALLLLHTICCRLLKAGLKNVCLLCNGGFETLDSLQNHMTSHVQLSPSICDSRNSFFGNYGCSETDVTDENGKLIGRQLFNIKAEKIDVEGSVLKFPCFHCGKWFLSLYFLLAHCGVCDLDYKNIYYCGLCCWSCTSVDVLYKHMQNDLNSEEISDVLCYQTGPALPSISLIFDYKLQILGSENKSRSKKTCCAIKFSYCYLPKGVSAPYHYLCDVCNFAFDEQGHLNLHEQFCHSSFLIQKYKPFGICTLCGVAFDDFMPLRKHMERHKRLVVYENYINSNRNQQNGSSSSQSVKRANQEDVAPALGSIDFSKNAKMEATVTKSPVQSSNSIEVTGSCKTEAPVVGQNDSFETDENYIVNKFLECQEENGDASVVTVNPEPADNS